MLYEQRIEKIRSILEKNGCVSVIEMAKATGVTEKTIRLDLSKMAEMEILERVHGGAVLKKGNLIFPVASRKLKHMEDKKAIAKKAINIIEEGDIILLDAGTTCLELAKLLGNKEIIVITNDPFIIYELLDKEKISLYSLGGKLKREGSYVFCGSDAQRNLRNYNVTKCFFGTSALNMKQGLMVFSVEEAELKREMILCSKQKICLVDSSKFNKIAFTSFSSIKSLDAIITDKNVSQDDVNALKKIGVDVLLADE